MENGINKKAVDGSGQLLMAVLYTGLTFYESLAQKQQPWISSGS